MLILLVTLLDSYTENKISMIASVSNPERDGSRNLILFIPQKELTNTLVLLIWTQNNFLDVFLLSNFFSIIILDAIIYFPFQNDCKLIDLMSRSIPLWINEFPSHFFIVNFLLLQNKLSHLSIICILLAVRWSFCIKFNSRNYGFS